MGYRDYSTAKGHIVDATGHGDFTTIQSAITAASSGQTVFIRPGTYTENITTKAGVNLCAYECDGFDSQVNIVGKITHTATGNIAITGVTLTTNSDFFLACTGTNVCNVYLRDCTCQATNNTGISFTNSNASTNVTFDSCLLSIGTSGIALFSKSGTGVLVFSFCRMGNNGSSTASTDSAGSTIFYYCIYGFPISISGAATIIILFSECQTNVTNSTAVTLAGTGSSRIQHCDFTTGTASSLVIGAGTTLLLTNTSLLSSNANVLTGAGTLQYAFIVFAGSSSGHNVTVETPLATLI